MNFAKVFLFGAIFFFSIRSVATTHIITFQSFSYSPSTLQVTVGDTIEWMGSFSFHPLQDSVIPAGAEAFGPVSSGATFIYPVKAAGTYWYHCNNHFAFGMNGTFIAAAASGVKPETVNISAVQNFPNPFGKQTIIRYTLSNASNLEIKLFDLAGKEVRHIAAGYQPAGQHEITLDAADLPSGTYMYSLQCSEAVLTRQMIIAK